MGGGTPGAVSAEVDDDAIEPRVEASLAAKLSDRAERPEKGLLDHVLRFVPILQEMGREEHRPGAVAAMQLAECGLIPRLAAAHERLLFCHSTSECREDGFRVLL